MKNNKTKKIEPKKSAIEQAIDIACEGDGHRPNFWWKQKLIELQREELQQSNNKDDKEIEELEKDLWNQPTGAPPVKQSLLQNVSEGNWRYSEEHEEVTTSEIGIVESSKRICRVSDFDKSKEEVKANGLLLASAKQLALDNEALVKENKDLAVSFKLMCDKIKELEDEIQGFHERAAGLDL